MEVYINLFLTLVLCWGQWSASRLGRFTPGECLSGVNWV
jgi:hypothetical protein